MEHNLYDLSTMNTSLTVKEIMNEISLKEYINLFESINFDGQSEIFVEWQSYNDDMIRLSKQFPDVVFRLEVKNDDYLNFYVIYYLNGKAQKEQGKITYPEFDPALLK